MINESERLRIAEVGMYRPEYEGDACGVGLVAATDDNPSPPRRHGGDRRAEGVASKE